MDAPLSQVKAILQAYDWDWDMAEQKSPERQKPARSFPQPTLF
jgi:hypothetical protein